MKPADDAASQSADLVVAMDPLCKHHGHVKNSLELGAGPLFWSVMKVVSPVAVNVIDDGPMTLTIPN